MLSFSNSKIFQCLCKQFLISVLFHRGAGAASRCLISKVYCGSCRRYAKATQTNATLSVCPLCTSMEVAVWFWCSRQHWQVVARLLSHPAATTVGEDHVSLAGWLDVFRVREFIVLDERALKHCWRTNWAYGRCMWKAKHLLNSLFVSKCSSILVSCFCFYLWVWKIVLSVVVLCFKFVTRMLFSAL